MGRIEKNRKGVKGEGRGGGSIEIREILSTATSTQIPNHKTNKKKNDISKQLSKGAIRQGKLREITKCLLTQFSKLQVEL